MGCFKALVEMHTTYYKVLKRRARDRERRNDSERVGNECGENGEKEDKRRNVYTERRC